MPEDVPNQPSRHQRLLSGTSNTLPSTVPETDTEPTTNNPEKAKSPPWAALFYFMTSADILVLFFACIGSIVAGAVSPAQSFLTGKVFEGFIIYASGQKTPDEFMESEKKWILYLVGISAGSWFFHSMQFIAWVSFGEIQAKTARDRLFHGLLEKDIAWYEMHKNGVAALLPRIQAQIRDLQLATSQPLGVLLALTSTATLSLGQAFYNSWDLTLVTLAGAPVIVFIILLFGAGTQNAIDRQGEKLTEAQKYSSNAFSAIETVKCFNGQGLELRKYKDKIAEAAVWYSRIANKNAMQTGCLVFLTQAMFVQAFYYGGVLINNHKKSSSQIVTTFFSAIGAFQALQMMLPQMIVMEKGRAAGANLRNMLSQTTTDSTAAGPSAQPKPMTCTGNIHLENVSFRYPARPTQLALDDVTMYLSGGELSFLIGKSGSGKSTIGQLLLRFYSHEAGSIILDGEQLELLDIKWLRSKVTLVEQTSLMFNESIFRNVAFGRIDWKNVTKAEVSAAIEFALLQLMVSDLPDGLDSMIGHGGGALSGGQRQRLALARARLRDTPILILDESTSALDHISRALMMDAIRQWRQGKTTIVITHDISQILPDDYAFVLEHGRLVQEGYRKHMEKMKDSPFQDFLPLDQRATISPFDARKNTAFESIRTRGSSLDDSFDNADSSKALLDPPEAEYNIRASKRLTFLPSLYIEGSPIFGLRPQGNTGPASALATPFMRMTVSPPTQFPRYMLGKSSEKPQRRSWLNPLSQSIAPHEDVNNGGKRVTLMLEDLIEKTGNTAAAARRAKEEGEDGKATARVRRLSDGHPDENPNESKTKSATSHGPDQQTFRQILRTLWPSISWPMRMLLVLGFWGGTIHAVATPLFSYVLSKLLALYADPRPHDHQSLVYSMTILGIAACDALHTYAYRFFLEYVSQSWVDSLRSESMRRVLRQQMIFFAKDENSVFLLAEGLDRNAEEMRNLLGRFVGMIYMAVIMVSVSMTWAIVAQWKMTLIALSAAPYIFVVTNGFSAVSERWEGLSNTASEQAGSVFTEALGNIKTVKSMTLETHFCNKHVAATRNALKVGLLRALFSGCFYGLADSAGTFATALVFYVGTRLVRDGVEVFAVVQVFTMLIFTIQNVSAILDYMPQIGSAKDTATRLLRLAQLPKDGEEPSGDARIANMGEIQFNDVKFAYPARPDLRILAGIDLKVVPGSTIAIVGGSGSGKSTIANLLLKLYFTPTAPSSKRSVPGDITISGRDIKHVHTGSLRSVVGVVSQTPRMFAATVAENITYGLEEDSPYNSDIRVTAAAREASIHDFIASLPSGYDTLVGEGGMGLSGGQAQRISIARALVRQPSVLILDEATSALDAESAAIVRNAITNLVEKRAKQLTVIIITHSRDMMQIASNIVVLDQGRIAESGGFDELMARNGFLSNLLAGGEWTEDAGERKRERHVVPFKDKVNWQ